MENNPIRVLHIVGTMNRGGAETLIMELYRHVDRNKVQFDFLIYNYSGVPGAFDDEIRSMGGKIYEAKRRLYRGPLAYCMELKRFFISHPDYRIVHAHQYATSGYMLAMAKKTTNPTTIAHSHIAFPITDFLRRCADSIGKKLLKKYADYYFGCAEDALVALSGAKSDDSSKFVMRNAINPEKFLFSQGLRIKWRKALGANENTIILGNVARFTYQKNHEHIIRTFETINARKPDSLLVLIGTGSRVEEMKNLVYQLGISDKVIFMGSRGDVNEIVNAFDIFLMPSRYEGLGIVLIEAQANGMPCVITEKFIPEEADVGAGLVYRVGLDESPEKWADSCLDAIKKGRIDPEKSLQAVRDAGYDISSVANWLQEFYLSHWS